MISTRWSDGHVVIADPDGREARIPAPLARDAAIGIIVTLQRALNERGCLAECGRKPRCRGCCLPCYNRLRRAGTLDARALPSRAWRRDHGLPMPGGRPPVDQEPDATEQGEIAKRIARARAAREGAAT